MTPVMQQDNQIQQGRFVTQSDVLFVLRSDGYDVNLRTLRYWRSVGLLPRLYQNGGRRGYPVEIISTLKQLCNQSGRLVGNTLFIHYLEEAIFKVYRVVIEKPKGYNGKYRVVLYTDQGILVERRSDLNGLY
tara:strand:- start:2195 stop:2590 length:396 start_codon:yes stop_codon:yes gene_type:complete